MSSGVRVTNLKGLELSTPKATVVLTLIHAVLLTLKGAVLLAPKWVVLVCYSERGCLNNDSERVLSLS